MALTISHSPKQHTPRELCVHLWRKENNNKRGITVCSGLSLGTQASQPASQPAQQPACLSASHRRLSAQVDPLHYADSKRGAVALHTKML